MRTAIVALITTIALLSSVMAAPRKVLVLPLDGNAPAEQKAQLDESLIKLTKANADGDVTVGDTTFAETASAVGCDPQTPECAETVRSTLAVDELIYGNADTADGTTTVTVQRASKDAPSATQVAVIAETDTGDKAEAALEPMFGSTSVVPEDPAAGSDAGSAAVGEPVVRKNFFDTRERKLGVGLAAGGTIALVIGLSFWAAKSDLQEQIDNHPNETLTELQALAALEDRAGERALWGNLMVALGLGLGGAGAYYLYKDHQNRSTTVAPAPVEAGTGMTLVLRGRW